MGAVQEKIWFVYVADHHEGPLNLDEVGTRLAAGEINKDSLAWKDGMPDWVSISSIPELAEIAKSLDQQNAQKDPATYMTLQFTEGGAEAPPAAKPESDVGGTTGSLAARLAQKQKEALAEEAAPPMEIAEGGGEAQPTGGDQGLSFDLGDSGAAGLDLEQQAPSKLIQRGEIPAAAPVVEQTKPSMLTAARMRADTAPAAAPTGLPAAAPAGVADVLDESEQVWSVQSNGQVSGLYTYAQIRELSASGQLPPGYLMWRPGWTSFQADPYASSAAPAMAPPLQMQPTKSTVVTKTGTNVQKPEPTLNFKPKLNPLPSAPEGTSADAFADEDALGSPESAATPAKVGFRARLAPVLALLQKAFAFLKKSRAGLDKTETKASAEIVKKLQGTGIIVPKGGGESASSSGGAGGSRRLILLGGVGGVLVLVGGAWAMGIFGLLFASLPEIPEISPDDYARLKSAASTSKSDGVNFAVARSTDEADLLNPVIFIATNAPEGQVFQVQLKGIPGTLVNVVSYQLKAEGPVDDTKLVKIGPISEGTGKPLPMGEYMLSVSTEGGEAYSEKIFVGNRAGPAYDRRMKSYNELLQKWYDFELGELRQLSQTLLGIDRAIGEKYASLKNSPNNNSLVLWDAFVNESNQVMAQALTKLKEVGTVDTASTDGRKELFFPFYNENAQKFIGLLTKSLEAHSASMRGGAAATLAAADVAAMAEIRQGLEALQTRVVEDKPLNVLVKNLDPGPNWSWPKTIGGAAPAPAAAVPAAPAATAPPAATAKPATVAPAATTAPAAAKPAPAPVLEVAPAPAAPATPAPAAAAPAVAPAAPAAAPATPAAATPAAAAPATAAPVPPALPPLVTNGPPPGVTTAPAQLPATPTPPATPPAAAVTPATPAAPAANGNGLSEEEKKALEAIKVE